MYHAVWFCYLCSGALRVRTKAELLRESTLIVALAVLVLVAVLKNMTGCALLKTDESRAPLLS